MKLSNKGKKGMKFVLDKFIMDLTIMSCSTLSIEGYDPDPKVQEQINKICEKIYYLSQEITKLKEML